MSSYEDLKNRYAAANQSHVFAYWDKLDEKGRDELLTNIDKIDIERACRVFTNSINANVDGGDHDSIKPLPNGAFDTTIGDETAANVQSWRKIGLDAIGAGRVGVLLMAGGQGHHTSRSFRFKRSES